MLHRPGRSLAVASVAAASVAVACVSAAMASPASASRTSTHPASASASPTRPLGLALAGLSAASAGAHGTSTRMAAPYGGYPLHVSTLTSKVVAPLQLSVSRRYGVLVGDSGTSQLDQVVRHGDLRTLAKGPQPGDVAGVDVSSSGAIAYTSTNYATGLAGLTILRHGHKPVVADLSAFEKENNPDQVVHYGIDNPTQCQTDALAQAGIPASYTGEVDSHPYAVAAVRGGWVVADAGGNDLLFVNDRGRVRLLTLLPRQPHTLTAAEATALNLPACLVVRRTTSSRSPRMSRSGAQALSTSRRCPEARRVRHSEHAAVCTGSRRDTTSSGGSRPASQVRRTWLSRPAAASSSPSSSPAGSRRSSTAARAQ